MSLCAQNAYMRDLGKVKNEIKTPVNKQQPTSKLAHWANNLENWDMK